MKVIKKIGDLISEGIAGNADIIVHQANLYHTFGAGIARSIRERLPYAFVADKQSSYGNLGKLSTFTYGLPNENYGESGPIVVNLYSQVGMYPSHTSYNALHDGLVRVRKFFEPLQHIKTIGFPVKMGCGIADGKWSIVRAIILAVFEDSRLDVLFVEFVESSSDGITRPESRGRINDAEDGNPLLDLMIENGVAAFNNI